MVKNISKIKVLDGLRGYAALMIILAHLPQISDTSIGHLFKQVVLASKIGYLGVDIFFVLSGFLITRILMKEKKENTFSLRMFYIKRSLRIFPIYYLSILVCGVLFSWHGLGYVSVYLSNYYFAFVEAPHPLRHAWSLAVEEHYYLLWPIIIYHFRLERLQKMIPFIIPVLVIGSLIITYMVFDTRVADDLVYRGTQFRVLSLSIGSFLAFYESKLNSSAKTKGIFVLFSFILVYTLAILLHRTIIVDIFPKAAILLILFSICSSLLFLIVFFQEEKKNMINYVLTNKIIVFVGKISYGLYLYHYIIFYFFKIIDNGSDPLVVSPSEIFLPVSLVFLISILSYYVIEQPFLKYKSRLTKRYIKQEVRK